VISFDAKSAVGKAFIVKIDALTDSEAGLIETTFTL
jgi:hypothetical protein